MNPNFPIYIPSKGRWSTLLTSHRLHAMGVPHFIIVEEQEIHWYEAAKDNSATLLVLDRRYQQEYDPCDELGDSKSKGPGPARNFAWDHSLAGGHSWHWVMDDNTRWFYRLNRNRLASLVDGTAFRVMEEFCQRYENVVMAGPNYLTFIRARERCAPFVANTRIYSCNLIRNDLPYRWRGRYNEDTDLSLRMLKDGWCTIQFNAFLQDKETTQRIPGGNTKEFYEAEGTLPKSQMIVDLHPDVARLVERWGRWHHYVDYGPFRYNRLRRKKHMDIKAGVDNYGMRLVTVGGKEADEYLTSL